MIITATKLPATGRIGTRVAATDETGNRALELWDYNATDETNYLRAVKLIAADSRVFSHIGTGIGSDSHIRWYRAN